VYLTSSDRFTCLSPHLVHEFSMNIQGVFLGSGCSVVLCVVVGEVLLSGALAPAQMFSFLLGDLGLGMVVSSTSFVFVPEGPVP